MDSHIIINSIKTLDLILGCNLLLCDLIAPLDFFDESIIVVLHITLLENNWGNFVLVCDLLLVLLAWVLLFTPIGRFVASRWFSFILPVFRSIFNILLLLVVI